MPRFFTTLSINASWSGLGFLPGCFTSTGRKLSDGRARDDVRDPLLAERERDVLLRVLLEDADVAVFKSDVALELHVVENLFLYLRLFH